MPPTSKGATRSLSERRALLVGALEALRQPAEEPESRAAVALGWLNTWKGVGAIITGMTAQGYDLELMQQPHGWWARFYLTGASHPVCAGSGWAVTPWAAVQAAAWETLTVANPEARLREERAEADATRRPNPAGGPAAVLRAAR